MFALSNGTNAKLRQARADFIASDTSTGLGESTRGEVSSGTDRFAELRNVEGVSIRLGTQRV